MTITEIKSKINKVLDDVPEGALVEILAILSEFQNKAADQQIILSHFQKILLEDEELLHKLAQ
jgi:hypothetical protein